MPAGNRADRGGPQDSGRPHWKMIFLAAIGSGIEFYDFIVYAVFARSIAATFFNFGDGATPLLITYALFAISYFVRPVGGLITSYCVDRFGRRPVFLWTLAIMSGCSILMGLLPGTAVLGPASAAAFIALRLVQSGCFGGELGGAVTYVTEIAPRRAGTACGILFGMLGFGAIAATLVNATISTALPAGSGGTDRLAHRFHRGRPHGAVRLLDPRRTRGIAGIPAVAGTRVGPAFTAARAASLAFARGRVRHLRGDGGGQRNPARLPSRLPGAGRRLAWGPGRRRHVRWNPSSRAAASPWSAGCPTARRGS